MEENLTPDELAKLQDEFNAEIFDADGEGMDVVYRKYAPILEGMQSQQAAYYKHLLAVKHGRGRIIDPDIRELWTAIRKLLFAVRTMSSRG